MFRKYLFLSLVIFNGIVGLCISKDSIILKPGFQIYFERDAPISLQNAVNILQRDLRNVLGQESTLVHDPAQLNHENSVAIITGMLDSNTLTVKKFGGFEAHKIFTQDSNVILQGADLRGTIYAIFTFSEKFLNIKPLWFWASLKPEKKNQLIIPANYSLTIGDPYVKYRAWFPNDMDLLTPWRKRSALNNEIWLETMLRLKLNTVNWNGNSFDRPYSISEEYELIKKYGMLVTFHHHNPLNACFSRWEDYWTQQKKHSPPELLLSNEEEIKEYWHYCVKCIVKNKMEVIWVINFRGKTDGPFWDTFKDAPRSMKERAEVINHRVREQIGIIRQECCDSHPVIRMIFYNELSDMLANGLLDPPNNIIWTFVAARRDHFPNDDLRKLIIPENVDLGYYMNLQFTSTGSHLAQAEGPWKMEQNYRYVNKKTNRPLLFSEVNAGNIREHVLTLSANAAMLWNFQDYKTDEFLLNFCNQYYGESYGEVVAGIYKEFFYSYWNQKNNDIEDFERQYIFHDLRYQKAVGQIAKKFFQPYDPNPLKDMSNEQVENRTFQIVPQDNGTKSQIDAIILGTQNSIAKLNQLTQKADNLYTKLNKREKTFFNDNLRVQAYFMLNLNKALHNFCVAYKYRDSAIQKQYLKMASQSANHAQCMLHEAAHDDFISWYDGERIFNIVQFVKQIDDTLKHVLILSQKDKGQRKAQ